MEAGLTSPGYKWRWAATIFLLMRGRRQQPLSVLAWEILVGESVISWVTEIEHDW